MAVSGSLSLPLDYLRNTVAGSSTFQTWTSSISQAAAKAHVHVIADETMSRPLAWVEWAPGWKAERIGTSAFWANGELRLVFQADVSGESTLDAQAEELVNNVGAIVSEMLDLAGEATYLDIVGISLIEGPYLPEEDEAKSRGEYMTIEFDVEFNSLP